MNLEKSVRKHKIESQFHFYFPHISLKRNYRQNSVNSHEDNFLWYVKKNIYIHFHCTENYSFWYRNEKFNIPRNINKVDVLSASFIIYSCLHITNKYIAFAFWIVRIPLMTKILLCRIPYHDTFFSVCLINGSWKKHSIISFQTAYDTRNPANIL